MRCLASQQEGDADEQPSYSQVCCDTAGHRSLPTAPLRLHLVLGLAELALICSHSSRPGAVLCSRSWKGADNTPVFLATAGQGWHSINAASPTSPPTRSRGWEWATSWEWTQPRQLTQIHQRDIPDCMMSAQIQKLRKGGEKGVGRGLHLLFALFAFWCNPSMCCSPVSQEAAGHHLMMGSKE